MSIIKPIAFVALLAACAADGNQASPRRMVVDGAEKSFGGQSFALTPDKSLGEALDAWNLAFGALATPTVVGEPFTIDDETLRQDVVAAIAAGWAPDFITDPANPTIVSTDALAAEELDYLASLVDGVVAVGDSVYTISWHYGAETFETLAIVDSDGMVQWENLTFLSMVAASAKATAGATGLWIWGSERGHFNAEVTASCDAAGHVVACTYSCTCDMQLGSADCPCELTQTASCCILKYAYALKTPLVTAKFKKDPWSFEISGVGSCISGNGQINDCCPAAGIVPPIGGPPTTGGGSPGGPTTGGPILGGGGGGGVITPGGMGATCRADSDCGADADGHLTCVTSATAGTAGWVACGDSPSCVCD